MTEVATPQHRAVTAVLLGWAGVIVFAGLMAATSDDSLGNAAIFGVVGAAMGSWVAARRSAPSLWVSLLIGGLHAVEQTAYFGAGVSGGEGATRLFIDAFGLVTGLLVAGGAAMALRSRRGAGPTAPRPDERTGSTV